MKPLLRIILLGFGLLIVAAEIPLIVQYDGSVPATPVVFGTIVAALIFQQIVTSRIIWKRPWYGLYLGIVLVMNSNNGLQGRPSTPVHWLHGSPGDGFRGVRLFGELRVEWRMRQEGV